MFFFLLQNSFRELYFSVTFCPSLFVVLQGDEPNSYAQRNLQHFDHSFKGELQTTSGPVITSVFGAVKGAKRPIQLICKGSSIVIVEEVGITSKSQAELPYVQVNLLLF